MNPAIVIVFTGAFGSGCTTAAKHCRDTRGFKFCLFLRYSYNAAAMKETS